MSNTRTILATATVALAIGAAAGLWLSPRMQEASPQADAGTGAPAGERQPLLYRNPMNPAITSPVPAKDEMGMDYIPVYADAAGATGPAGTVSIDPVVVQNIGVRTARAERRDLARTVRAVGRVTHDEDRLVRIHPKTDGWIEKLHAGRTGETVRRGEPLFAFHAPQIVTAEQEYLLALRNREVLAGSPHADIRRGAEDLVQGATDRLRFLGVSSGRIEALARSGRVRPTADILAPADGTIMKIGAREGQYIGPMTEVYQLADLSRVWVVVDVYEDDLPWVAVGDTAELRMVALPDRAFTGRVGFIYPTMAERTRTARLRLEFDNPDGLLKPDLYAEVTLNTAPQRGVVTVPAEAVVRSGTRAQVFVQREPGRFEPREVELGLEASGFVQVRAGVEAGEAVVTSAQFLIDSESKLREATAKLLDAGGPDSVTTHTAEGVIDDVDSDARSLSIEHGPVESLGWPGMTMDFLADESVAIADLAEGEAVRFEFVEREPGEWVVTRIDRAGAHADHGAEAVR